MKILRMRFAIHLRLQAHAENSLMLVPFILDVVEMTNNMSGKISAYRWSFLLHTENI
jgi:hypothetical protein